MPVRIGRPSDLSEQELREWLRLQQLNPSLQSPYLCSEFISIAATVRPGIVVLVMEEQGMPKAFLPLQMRGSSAGPVACPLSDYQALIAAKHWRFDMRELLREARITAYDFFYYPLDWRIRQAPSNVKADRVCRTEIRPRSLHLA